MFRPGTHIASSGNHFISSSWVTEIIMMKVMHFLCPYLNPIWPPCLISCYRYSRRLTNVIDTKPSTIYFDRPVVVSKWNSWPLFIQVDCQGGHFEFGFWDLWFVMSRPGTQITSNWNHYISSIWVTEIVMINVILFLVQ